MNWLKVQNGKKAPIETTMAPETKFKLSKLMFYSSLSEYTSVIIYDSSIEHDKNFNNLENRKKERIISSDFQLGSHAFTFRQFNPYATK